MQDIFIPSTKKTPSLAVNFKQQQIDIIGESHSEKVKSFYESILNLIRDIESFFVNEFNKQNTAINLRINFKLNYFNSSSAKYILILIKSFQDIEINSNNKINVHLNWFYEAEDDDNLYAGQEMARLTKTTMHFISY